MKTKNFESCEHTYSWIGDGEWSYRLAIITNVLIVAGIIYLIHFQNQWLSLLFLLFFKESSRPETVTAVCIKCMEVKQASIPPK